MSALTKLGQELEPSVVEIVSREAEYLSAGVEPLEVAEASTLSIAISLKRIADRLDDIASGAASIRVQNNY